MPESAPTPARPPPPGWPRFALAQALQLPAAGLILATPTNQAWLVAGLWGSVVCCAATDSGWRWRNRLLVAQAAAWLVAAMLAW